jgi:hypothetical protein
MILTDLRIQLMDYGPNKGEHTGKATFTGKTGEVTLRLNRDHIEQIFLTCASSIEETAKAAARHLTMTVIEHRKELEETK